MSWKIRLETGNNNCIYRKWFDIDSTMMNRKYHCYEPNFGRGLNYCNEAECPLRIVDDDKEAEKMVRGTD